MKLPSKEQYDNAVDYFFHQIDESFTFGSDNEGIGDWLKEEFDDFWGLYTDHGDVPGDLDIRHLAVKLESELYAREAIAELRHEN
jgi:hypothetical protein